MDMKFQEMLKRDLAKAIKEKNFEEVYRLKKLLNIPTEQEKYFDLGLTGFPSIDKVWLTKHFRPGVEEYVQSAPKDKTVWDVIEEKLLEYYDYPALTYFGRLFSRPEFIELCYTWARTFRAMGVNTDEVVPIYGPFVPDICAMVFALNMIGASPYFLKLDINDTQLAKETKDAKVAVVFDGMWGNVAREFSKDRFKNVIVASAANDMPSPKKEIVSFISAVKALKNKSRIPDEKKYIWIDKAKEIANYYSGDVKVQFVPGRTAFVTSSSGTTVGGEIKGIMDTNESAIAQLFMSDATDVQFFPGDLCLNHFPPAASTSLNVLFLLPLYRGMTIQLDPRVSVKDFFNQIVYGKPNISINTASMWEQFFNRVKREMAKGRKFDFSYAKVWVVGGEGTTTEKIREWNEIMRQCGNEIGMVSAYGLSEFFASTCTEKFDARCPFDKKVMGVGVPYAGLDMGVFDEDGNELSYNQRGVLWFRGPTAMKGYYNKPELTESVKRGDWITTGDLAEIDDEGFVYIWGRITDKIVLDNNKNVYLFDVANVIRDNDYIDDAMVLSMPTTENKNNLVAHIVWKENVDESMKVELIKEMNEQLKEFLPEEVEVSAFAAHKGVLPYSPTTLKKDKNGLSRQYSGYVQVINDKLYDVDFTPYDVRVYSKTVAFKEKSKVKSLFKNMKKMS